MLSVSDYLVVSARLRNYLHSDTFRHGNVRIAAVGHGVPTSFVSASEVYQKRGKRVARQRGTAKLQRCLRPYAVRGVYRVADAGT